MTKMYCPRGGTKLTVEVGTKALAQVPYRIPDRLKQGVRDEISALLQRDVIENSYSA